MPRKKKEELPVEAIQVEEQPPVEEPKGHYVESVGPGGKIMVFVED